MGMSYPLGAFVLVSVLLLWIIYAGRAQWWGHLGHIGFLLVLVVVLWVALSRTQYERIREQYPDETRLNWILNWLVFGAAIPLFLWLLLGLPFLVRALHA